MSATSENDAVLLLDGLTKEFKTGFLSTARKRVLDAVSLSVRRGDSFGFLGPNGAGKTTTIKILVGLISPTRGRVQVLGHPPSDRRARQRLGYLPENPSYSDGLTGREVLRLMCRLLGMRRNTPDEIDRVLKRVDLTRAGDVPVRRYSKGMTQRLGIAQALLNNPDLVILDEPMSGLDPVGRREIKDLIRELRDAGKTVFFSTHIISDVEEVCDRLAIIVDGQIVKQGSVGELIGAGTREVEVLATNVPQDFPVACSRAGAGARFAIGDQTEVRPLLEKLWGCGAQVIAVRPLRYGLEDVFIQALRVKGATSGNIELAGVQG